VLKFLILLGLGAWGFFHLKGKLMATTQEVIDEIKRVGAQLAKAKAEIVGKITDLETQIANGAGMDDVLTALGELKTAAQGLDDVVADPVDPPVEPAP
jgi:hypothetical protein